MRCACSTALCCHAWSLPTRCACSTAPSCKLSCFAAADALFSLNGYNYKPFGYTAAG